MTLSDTGEQVDGVVRLRASADRVTRDRLGSAPHVLADDSGKLRERPQSCPDSQPAPHSVAAEPPAAAVSSPRA